MSENSLTTQHKRAVKLHRQIVVNAELAQQNLFDMCSGLKEMRDTKLYKELGYNNFEDYCETEVGMTRRNVYRYIDVVEKVNAKAVTSMSQIGMTKLALLATISEQEQAEIAEKVDLEHTTVKQLTEEINKLKAENSEMFTKVQDAERNKLLALQENKSISNQVSNLKSKIEELESRPIEVAAVESSDNERRLQETIKSLERENIKHYDELEAQYREDEQTVRRMLENDKQQALADLKAEYEQKLSENNVQVSNEYISYMAALKNADNALKTLITCVCTVSNNEYHPMIKTEIDSLISKFNKNIELAI